jgi:hypothetical protein
MLAARGDRLRRPVLSIARSLSSGRPVTRLSGRARKWLGVWSCEGHANSFNAVIGESVNGAKRGRHSRVFGFALIALVALGGWAVPVSAASKHTVHGTLQLDDDSGTNAWIPASTCQSDSVSAGEQVTVKNAKGSIIGVGQLSDGTPGPLDNGGSVYTCTMHFSVRVPQTSFYQFAVGESHGSVIESLAKMKRNGWRVRFTLSQ